MRSPPCAPQTALSDAQEARLTEAFHMFDRDGDVHLSYSELIDVMRAAEVSVPDLPIARLLRRSGDDASAARLTEEQQAISRHLPAPLPGPGAGLRRRPGLAPIAR